MQRFKLLFSASVSSRFLEFSPFKVSRWGKKNGREAHEVLGASMDVTHNTFTYIPYPNLSYIAMLTSQKAWNSLLRRNWSGPLQIKYWVPIILFIVQLFMWVHVHTQMFLDVERIIYHTTYTFFLKNYLKNSKRSISACISYNHKLDIWIFFNWRASLYK